MFARIIHALRSRIALKLTLTLVGFVAVTMMLVALYLSRGLERVAIESIEARLGTAARVLEDEARATLRAGGEARSVQTFVERAARRTNSRVTLVAPDGRVLADSERRPDEVAEMDNHAARPEVRAALNGSVGRDLRRSSELGAPLIYVAVPVSESGRVVGALRLAAPLEARLHLIPMGIVQIPEPQGLERYLHGRRAQRPVRLPGLTQ